MQDEESGSRNFLYAALDTTAYAVFTKESRMRCINATKLHRKSGVMRALPCAYSYTLATLESRLCKK
jgi:hypothetical protein